MIRRLCVFALAASTVAGSAVPASATATAKPSTAAIKKALTAHYTDKTYATRIYSIKWGSFQFGAPRLGNYLTDGVPANTKTTVYPVRVKFVRTAHYTTDNTNTIDTIVADYVFFKDEFGAWTFRIKREQLTTAR